MIDTRTQSRSDDLEDNNEESGKEKETGFRNHVGNCKVGGNIVVKASQLGPGLGEYSKLGAVPKYFYTAQPVINKLGQHRARSDNSAWKSVDSKPQTYIFLIYVVYPSSKPKDNTNANTKTTTTATPNRRLPPPPNKTTPTQTTTRHPYRPNPTTTRIGRRRHRSYACLCCFWSFLIITLLLLITAITGCIFYLLYHPHRPSFSLAALKISEFNLTASDDTTRLTSNLNLTLSIRNPNKKITFYYNSITVMCSSHDTIISKGTYPNPITSKPNNITIIHSPLHIANLLLEPETVNKFRSDLKKKSGLPLTLVLDTEARVKVETIKTKKIGIRIKCEGIHSLIPKGGHRNSSSVAAVAANVDDAKCKLDLRIKIWKWTF
ncbi:NDR1/HIN1-like protein 10 [Bidens hawaiensis]|uniref:NDR1/HIN1-like protein 10 n=1 Tax=Bidens hawaiensis TaxID=980011 RepID=UPI00404AF30B